MSNKEPSEQNNSADSSPNKVLVFQTAFLGDVILTLPLVEAIHNLWPEAEIHFIANPSATGVLENHPSIDKVITYDKRGKDTGLGGLFRFSKGLRKEAYGVVFSPHRSFRSALTLYLSAIKTRIGFSKTPGAFLYTNLVERHQDKYEGARNLELLGLFEDPSGFSAKPILPVRQDIRTVVSDYLPQDGKKVIALAPGSVWATKRWLKEHWKTLSQLLTDDGHHIILIGGPEDSQLCDRISENQKNIISAAGKTTILESTEIIRSCDLLITNDTAPLHLGVGVKTPVLAIFGPTVPEFGFAPPGEKDRVIGLDLECRPCAIHGSNNCPLGHFDCMKKLLPETILKVANEMI